MSKERKLDIIILSGVSLIVSGAWVGYGLHVALITMGAFFCVAGLIGIYNAR